MIITLFAIALLVGIAFTLAPIIIDFIIAVLFGIVVGILAITSWIHDKFFTGREK